MDKNFAALLKFMVRFTKSLLNDGGTHFTFKGSGDVILARMSNRIIFISKPPNFCFEELLFYVADFSFVRNLPASFWPGCCGHLFQTKSRRKSHRFLSYFNRLAGRPV